MQRLRFDFLNSIFRICAKSISNLELYLLHCRAFNIQNLENLKEIRIHSNHEDLLQCGFLNVTQILSAWFVRIYRTKLTFSEICQIPSLEIDQMNLTEEDVLEYIVFLLNSPRQMCRSLRINIDTIHVDIIKWRISKNVEFDFFKIRISI
ncbi:unnamed protein product [Caenorhabditis angaria]|uniref:Uncharacterized protein n=1 Tax=Caenorhabditis angaria TaxID=860376 RepID=A0A9P1ICC7_9PELO|nr:unnamed protein product [Caenorhabditis angaria]